VLRDRFDHPNTMAVVTVNLSRDWRTIEARLLEVIEVF